ncbi:hypothetical protein AVEN_233685-1 [Araneus ventricosus]|uniref:Uncharacterized protein n=1 Tax=Araneus ventricosus TaxID=182803 RepID=A0A4Y2Q0Y8_ARAVE|nr:hypothetical protein AVEN_233685-1 [Araneus ventricosus]
MQQKLFDICRCKCHDFDICRCEKVDKVTKAERVFLNDFFTLHYDTPLTPGSGLRFDQRSSRIMKIGSLDPARSLSAQSEERNDSSTEIEIGSNVATSKAAVCRNRILYPKVAVECDRYSVSDREAAAIVRAALQDSGQLKNDDLTLVDDRSKIRRERKRVRNELKYDSLTQINQNPVCGLYFDGRKDNTVVKIVKGEKYCRNIIKEELVTIVQEPKSKYIGHITV